MLVVDASAVAELLLGRPAARRVDELFAAYAFDLHAPHLIDIEVMSAVRRALALKHASASRATEAVTDLLDLPIERYPHALLLPRAWALRDNFSAYDAMYLALAESLTGEGAPLLTADRRFLRAGQDHSDIEMLAAG